jgi:uncharacterized protein YjiS (DUF1127 family)
MLLRLWKRLQAAIVAARTRAELQALSDHRLRDIGLRREEIIALFRDRAP